MLRFAAALSLVLGAAALLAYLGLMGRGPLANADAHHLRAMKERVEDPPSLAGFTLADFAELPHAAPRAEYSAIERRGVSIEGYVQQLVRAADDDYHLEIVPVPRGPDSPDTLYVTAEITPEVRGEGGGWTFGRLDALFRPNHGGVTAWDSGPRRTRVSGWLLYDYQYDVSPTEWQRRMKAPRVSGWEIHPVTRIEVWDDAFRAWREVPR